MLLRKPLLAAAAAIGCAASALGVISCSSGPAPVGASGASGATDAGSESGAIVLKDPGCTAGGLTVAFNPMYSAYDGKHTFQVPAVVVGSTTQVTWFADRSIVGMMPDSERPNEVLLTMLKAGDTTIHVQSADGKCGSAPLHITAALESDWEIGNKRYNDGVSVHLANSGGGTGGSPLEVSGSGGPACTNCHGETATSYFFTNVSHTPEQTGGFSDSQILDIVLRGMFPPGSAFDTSIVNYASWHSFHQWGDIGADQERGIIVYLRSLTPAPQHGAANFGAFMDSGTGIIVTDAALAGDDGSSDAIDDLSGDAGPTGEAGAGD